MRLITRVITGILLAASLHAAPTLISHACAGSPSGTTAPAVITINTTGANLLVVVGADYNSSDTVTDNRANTWTLYVREIGAAGTEGVSIWYASNPTVGSSHTFTVTGLYNGSCVLAFSGVAPVSPADGVGSHTAGHNVTSESTGNFTPSQSGDLLITGMSINLNNTVDSTTVDSGFTISDELFGSSSISVPCFVAWKVQGAASTVNATWSGASTTDRPTALAAFKSLPGSTSVKHRVINQ